MVKITFKELKVDELTKSSGIFSGKNQQFGFRSYNKVNQGFGVIDGNKNEAKDHIHVVIHSDDAKGE